MDQTSDSEEELNRLVRMAYRYQEAADTLAFRAQGPLSAAEQAACDRARERALRQWHPAGQRERSSARETWRRVTLAAACLVLTVFVAGAIALASSPYIRSQATRLLISVDWKEGVATFDFSDAGLPGFPVPADWTGLYFPSWLPDGFTLDAVENTDSRSSAVYTSGQQSIRFTEMAGPTHLEVRTEESSISEFFIDGQSVMLIREPDGKTNQLIWSTDDRMMMLEASHVSLEDMILMVEKVRRILP